MVYPSFRKRKPGQLGQVRRRRKTANWILATGGNYDPRKGLGTQRDANIGELFRLSSERRHPGKIEGHNKSVNGPKPKYCRREDTMQMSTANRRPRMPKRPRSSTVHYIGQVTFSDALLQDPHKIGLEGKCCLEGRPRMCRGKLRVWTIP